VLKKCTKSVNILLYVSNALQTSIGRQSPVIDIEESSDSSSEDDQDDTEEGGGKQIDTKSHSTPRDKKMAKQMTQRKGRWKMKPHHPHHLMVLFQIIAFHNTFYNETRAIFAIYVERYTT